MPGLPHLCSPVIVLGSPKCQLVQNQEQLTNEQEHTAPIDPFPHVSDHQSLKAALIVIN